METENKTLVIALRYLEMGWSVIPVKPDKKTHLATWKPYQDRLPTKEEVTDWFNKFPNAGIGIVTGKLSGLVVLDLDPGCDEKRLNRFNLPLGISVKTPRGGKHLYFKHPGTDVKTRTDLFGDASNIDIRGDGGYVIAPPSVREDGMTYEWINHYYQHGLEELPPNILEVINNKPHSFLEAKQSTILNGVEEGKRNDTAAQIVGQLISKIPSGNWQSEAWPRLKDWNDKNTPPLSDRELEKVFVSICKAEESKRTYNPPVRSEDMLAEMAKLKVELGEPISIGELSRKEIPEAKWAVQSLFESSTMNMISAAPNQYKSWVLQHIAICLAQGMPVFGHFDAEKQGVLIINEEDSERMLQERSFMLTECDLNDMNIYLHIMKSFKLGTASAQVILDLMKEKNLSFLMLDSFRSVHGYNENDSQQMQEVTDFIKLFLKEGITVLFTHHNRKVMRGFKKEDDGLGEEIRGSSSINAAVHSHLSLEVEFEELNRYLLVYQRKLKSDEKLKPFKVQFFIDEIEGDSFRFEYKGEHVPIDDAINKKTPEVMAFLEKEPNKWVSYQDLIDTGITYEHDKTTRYVLKRLVESKTIITKTAGELKKLNIGIDPKAKSNKKYYMLKIETTEVPDQGRVELDDW